jgi:hypothetical protein
MFHSSITVEEMFHRERVILTIEPQAILWYRGIVFYSSIGLPEAKVTNALTLGAPSALGRAPTAQNDELFRYTLFVED